MGWNAVSANPTWDPPDNAGGNTGGGVAAVSWTQVTGLSTPDSDTDSIVTSMTEAGDGTYTLTYDTNIADRASYQSWAHWWIAALVDSWSDPEAESLQIKIEIAAAASDRDGGPTLAAGVKRGGENTTSTQWDDNAMGFVRFDSAGNEDIGNTNNADASSAGSDTGTNPASVVFTMHPESGDQTRTVTLSYAYDSGGNFVHAGKMVDCPGLGASNINTHGTNSSGNLSFHFSQANTPSAGSGTIQFRLYYRFIANPAV